MTVAPSWGRKPIEERISMLKSPTMSNVKRSIGAVLATVVASGAAAGAWAAQPARVEAEGTGWSAAPITIAGENSTLRQAVEHVASVAGVRVSRADLLDEARPGADIDYSFNDTPGSAALQIMLEDVSMAVDYSIEAGGIRFTAKE